MRSIANVLMTGAYNHDEVERLRDAGWRWSACDVCGRSPVYAKDFECLTCRLDRVGRGSVGALSDAALSGAVGARRAGDGGPS